MIPAAPRPTSRYPSVGRTVGGSAGGGAPVGGTPGVAGPAAGWRAATVIVFVSPSAPTTTVVDQGTRPGADTAIVCSPRSIGTGAPHTALPTRLPSRRTSSAG